MAAVKGALLFGLGVSGLAFAATVNNAVILETRTALDTGIANIHIEVLTPLAHTIDVSYGNCDSLSTDETHHDIAKGVQVTRSSRLVWRVPEDSPSNGCLTAWNSETKELVAKSTVLSPKQKQKRSFKSLFNKRDTASISMNNASGIDTFGPWFDGVEYLKGRNVSEVDVKKVKSKRIGIIGGGMSGLMSALLLESQGFHNWEILESSQRVGGRIRTVYLEGKPEDYQYQEMGPMRFPERIIYPNETLQIKDHQIVFQLAAKLNELNGGNPKLSVDFIPFVQSHPNAPSYFNGIRNADGTVPTVTEAAAAAVNISAQLPPGMQNVRDEIAQIFYNPERQAAIADNMYRAHKQFLEEGWGDWSEFAFVRHYLGASLNITDQVISGNGESSFWINLFEGYYFTPGTIFRTIDKGLERLPLAFHPLLGKRVKFGRRIEKAEYSAKENKVKFSWRKNLKDKLKEEVYDYALVSVPFTQVRRWRLPQFSSLLGRAIRKLEYDTSCKLALQFKTRFWEHTAKPIFGGCASTDIPGITGFCYPSYKLNSTGPGVLLANYNYGDSAVRFVALTDDQHVQYVLNAMAEIHGPVVEEQYTGKYNRQCWLLDQNIAGSWASPALGQHELYIPAYFETENNIIFVGEHTSYTHAWIASALESAVRGTVQLMLEFGLVDEAKDITSTWMARWMVV